MKKVGFIIILFGFVILLFNANQAQTNRATKKSNAKDDWTPAEKGCKSFVVERKLRLPRNIKEVFLYLSYRLRGKNKVKGYEYNCLPVIDSFDLDKTEVTIRSHSNLAQNNHQPENSALLKISIKAHDLDGGPLLYAYSVSGGKIIGTGSNVVWDLSGVKPGAYTVSAWVDDGCGVCIEPTMKEVKVIECKECNPPADQPPPIICPRGISIKPSQEKIRVGETVTFTVTAEDWNSVDASKFVFNWTISNEEIVGGQRTKTLTVKVPPDFTGQTISVFVDTEDGICLHNPLSATVEVIKPQ